MRTRRRTHWCDDTFSGAMRRRGEINRPVGMYFWEILLCLMAFRVSFSLSLSLPLRSTYPNHFDAFFDSPVGMLVFYLCVRVLRNEFTHPVTLCVSPFPMAVCHPRARTCRIWVWHWTKYERRRKRKKKTIFGNINNNRNEHWAVFLSIVWRVLGPPSIGNFSASGRWHLRWNFC